MDDEQHNLELLQIFQSNLHEAEIQAARHGVTVPSLITNEIRNAKCNIAAIEAKRTNETPAVDQTYLQYITKAAQKAYFEQDWITAETLLAKWAAMCPHNTEILEKLTEARKAAQFIKAEQERQHNLKDLYQLICEFREKENWMAVLNALNDLERQQPGYPGTEELRQWALGCKHREQNCNDVLAACDVIIIRSKALEIEIPDSTEAQELLARARTACEALEACILRNFRPKKANQVTLEASNQHKPAPYDKVTREVECSVRS